MWEPFRMYIKVIKRADFLKSDGWSFFAVRICPEQQLLELRGNEKKRRWTCIDILKCLAAIAVIEIHKPLEIQGGR